MTMCPGTASINRRSSARVSQVPVGLLGLATNISRLRSLMADCMATGSCP